MDKNDILKNDESKNNTNEENNINKNDKDKSVISDLLKDKNLLNKMIEMLIEKRDLTNVFKFINKIDDVDVLTKFVETFRIPLPNKEDLLSKYPESAYKYAYYGLGRKRFLKGEPAILRSPKYAYLYTVNIIRKRWPEAEPIISSDPKYSFAYANIFRFRFKEGENTIIRNKELLEEYLKLLKEINEYDAFLKDHPFLVVINKYSQDEINFAFEKALERNDKEMLEKLLPYISKPYLALKYVQEITKKRTPEIEHLIARDMDYVFKYIKTIGESFKLAHSLIATNPEYSYKYALALGKPFPEGEDAIATSAMYSYLYARDVLKGRFPKGENVISTDPKYAFYYIKDIIKDRVKLWEPILRTNEEVWNEYLAFLNEIGKFGDWYIEEEERLKQQRIKEKEEHLREQQDKYYEEQQAKLEEEEKKKKKEKERTGWETNIEEDLF